MSNEVMVSEKTIEAAGVAVNVMDASRRVGWGKAFDAMRRADSAERDVNVLRSDNKILAAFAARAYGALNEMLGDEGVNGLFRGDNHELKSYFADGPFFAGKDAARRVIANLQTSPLWDYAAAVRARAAAEREALMAREDLVKHVPASFIKGTRRKERRDLAAHFGFGRGKRGEAAMFKWLQQYKGIEDHYLSNDELEDDSK